MANCHSNTSAGGESQHRVSGRRPLWLAATAICALILAVPSPGTANPGPHGTVDLTQGAPGATTTSLWAWFDNYGQYMMRIHCLRNADGTPDWVWIIALIAGKAAVIAGYLRIYFFWLKCYYSEEKDSRNKKLWQLANLFFICAVTGYVMSIVMFFWPAYRLTALLTFVLIAATYSFMIDLKPFEVTFAAVRLLRERDRAQHELSRRNSDMRRVLENVDQGFLTVDLTGQMSEERSRILDEWFPPVPAGTPVWDYLGQAEPGFATMFELCWEAVTDGILPLDLALEQLPNRIQWQDRTLELTYRPILEDNNTLSQVLVVTTDVTTQIQQERAEMLQIEMLAVFEKMMADRRGVSEFFNEASRLVHQITESKLDSVAQELRALHTLKGNCGMFGVASVARFCHDLETKIQDEQQRPNQSERLELQRLWEGVAARLAALLGERAEGTLQIADEDFDRLMAAIFEEVPRDKLARMLRAWRFEPTRLRLQRLGEQARALALRLGKGEINVELESNALRLPPERWARFWSAFSHVIRNAIDHGMETPDRRAALGKPAPTLHLSTRVVEGELVVSAQDDGPGVNWDKLRQLAESRGVPAQSQADLQAVLFLDGVSTREEVSEVSGRGVGMAAVKEAVEALDGRIEVESVPHQGTTMRFIFPRSALSSAQRTPGHRVIAQVPSAAAGVRSLFPSWPVGFDPTAAE